MVEEEHEVVSCGEVENDRKKCVRRTERRKRQSQTNYNISLIKR